MSPSMPAPTLRMEGSERKACSGLQAQVVGVEW